MSRKTDHVAYAEDAEEDSGSSVEGIEGTRKYAISEAPVSPVKERPNTGKSRSEKRPSHKRSESSSASLSLTDSSDSTARSGKKEKEPRRPSQKELDREREERELQRRKRDRKLKAQAQAQAQAEAQARAVEEERRVRAEQKALEKAAKALKKIRPAPKHSVTQPIVQQSNGYRRGRVEDPSCYGVPQPAASSSRPRAQTRPASYYAGQTSRPPLTSMNWHQSQSPAPQPFPHVVGTFPPPQHMLPPSPASHASHLPPSPLTMPGYFDEAMSNQHNHLKQRFHIRPSSAMGYQSPSTRGYPPDDTELESVSTKVSRRPSRVTKKSEEDKKKMPPPDFVPRRPQSAMPQSSAFAPPPPPQSQRPTMRRESSRPPALQRRSVGFVEQPGYQDEDFQGDVGLFHDMSPVAAYEPRRTLSGRMRGSSNAYEHQALDIVPANPRGRNVTPYGGGVSIGSYGASYEADKYMDALKYQEDVSGPQMPLTAETLRKVTKRGGVPSSRSTRSSGSRDDSEYKRSNTTGITRSSSGNNEDFIIKVSGTSVVRLHGAEIECSDGEIMLSSRPGGSGGSDMASTIFQIEDSRGRVERKLLPHRPRAPSQSDSQSRGYAPSHAPYDPTLSPDYF